MLRGHTDSVRHVAFASGGQVLANSGIDGTVRLWDVATGKPLRQLPARDKGIIAHLAFAPDGKTLATYGRYYDNKARLWDPATGKPRGEFNQHALLAGNDNPGVAVVFAPDSKIMAVASLRGTDIMLRDTATTKERAKITEDGPVDLFAFSADGKMLAVTSTGSDNGDTVRLWDLQMAKAIAAFPKEGKHDSVPDAAALLARWHHFGRAARGNCPSVGRGPPKLIKKLMREGELVASAFASDGEVLLVEQGVRTLDVWAVKAGRRLRSLRVEGVQDVVFSPDCSRLAPA